MTAETLSETFDRMTVSQFRKWYVKERARCDERGRSLLNTLHAPYLAQRHGWRALLEHFREMDAR